ncbi:hypothetical protein C0992_000373 [Termitomyces sp. T32_za158]|nr:hypothetical protein C0992_000373 [Termitomyces sp. T32_za158]
MSLAIGIWSLKLTPGKVETFQPPADLRITNAALGDVLKDASGRTTVKLTFEPSGGFDEEDEEEDVAPKPVTTVLCSLKPDTLEQTSIDLVLQEEDTYKFELTGKNTVYLTGNYIEQAVNNPPFGDDDSDMDSDEDAYDLRDVSSDVEMHPDDIAGMESDSSSRFEEVDEAPKNLKRAREAEEAEKPSKAEKKKKQKTEAQATEATPDSKKKKEKEAPKEKETPKEKAAPKEKGTPKEKETKETQEKSKAVVEKEITGGIKTLDAKVGSGPMAKKGNTVRVRYIGKLTNGKVFDKNTKGKPFTFQLGKGEVIKGWDEGVVGMQVGGERKLTIPPAMGYGSQSVENIPKNSTLVFEVKLLEIK